jgi:glycosyltransferase involved in cell wall biosynthesis
MNPLLKANSLPDSIADFRSTTKVRQPLVSIIVRTHQGRQGFLEECLNSLAEQTYAELEIIIVEDGGDESEPLAKAFAAASGRRLNYLSVPRQGRSRAGNLGLNAARGELLGFLDDDDQFLSEHVAVLVGALRERPEAAAACSLAYEVPTRVVSREPLAYTEAGRYVVHRRPFAPADLLARNFLPIQAVLFRRELFERLGGFSETLEMLEDWDLWIRYLVPACFVHVPQVTSLHRVPADAAEALARYRRMQKYRPRFAALHGNQIAGRESWFRRLGQKAISSAALFRLYWALRRRYYSLWA